MTDKTSSKGNDNWILSEVSIGLWENLTGAPVDTRNYKVTMGADFSLSTANKNILRAKSLNDSTAVTLIIRQLLDQYCQSTILEFSLSELLDGINTETEKAIASAKALKSHLDIHTIRSAHEAFFQDCCEALAFYRDRPVSEISASTRDFVKQHSGMVGLDAVDDLHQLTRLTMFEGLPSEDARPRVNHLVFAFETIEELIQHGASIPSGFSLCAITSTHISDSYFVLLVRNGERVIIVTDKGNYTHPLQQTRMRNRNDRYNLHRIESSRFPYGLLNIQWFDNGRRSKAGGEGRELVKNDTGFRVLGTLNDLSDSDLLWFHLFVQQCRQRYFVEGVTEPMMATGSMIRLTHPWAGEDSLPVPSSMQFSIQARTSADLSTEFMRSIETEWANSPNPNQWMEEQFADQVPDDSLYIPASALISDGMLPVLVSDNGAVSIDTVKENHNPWREDSLDLQTIDETALAPKERVVRDAHFIARHNQSEVIAKLVERDYEAREVEMLRWFNQAVVDHLPNIIDDVLALNHARFIVSKENHEALMQSLRARNGIASGGGYRRREVDVFYDPKAKQRIFTRAEDQRVPKIKHLLDLVDYDLMVDLCYLDGAEPANINLFVDVPTVADIMTLTGLTLDEIPRELHSRGIDIDVGNSILRRIDPLATLDNPWDKLPLRFSLPVSLKNLKAWRKDRGLYTPKATELKAWTKEQAREVWNEVRSNDKPARKPTTGNKAPIRH